MEAAGRSDDHLDGIFRLVSVEKWGKNWTPPCVSTVWPLHAHTHTHTHTPVVTRVKNRDTTQVGSRCGRPGSA